MFRLIVTLAACLLLASGCSTTHYQTLETRPPPIPEADLSPAPPLSGKAETGDLKETTALLVFVSGKYYELQSRFNDLAAKIRARQVDNAEKLK